MISLAFAVCIFHSAVIWYNCAAVHYDMHVSSLILEFVLVSLRLLILQRVVQNAAVAHSYFLVKSRLFTAVAV